MIFIGDIACPSLKVDSFISSIKNLGIFKNEIVVLNLEANILDEKENKRSLTLFNSPKVIDAFTDAKKVIVTMANNHMYDYPSKIQITASYLRSKNIGVFGICEKDGSVLPFEYEENGIKYAYFGHCWGLYTRTNTNNENNVRIVDHDYDIFANIVLDYVKMNPRTKVYCFMHWNYDREKLIMPMHRKFAHYLIDRGVEGVIGSHSHRPQGAEIYKGKPIVYGLGNFYLPSGIYFDGKLVYPDYAKETYALKISGENSSLVWFETDKDDKVISLMLEESLYGEKISKYSPFSNMSDARYVSYFKAHRSKSLFVPIFRDFQGKKYHFNEKWAICRVKVIRFIKKLVKR